MLNIKVKLLNLGFIWAGDGDWLMPKRNERDGFMHKRNEHGELPLAEHRNHWHIYVHESYPNGVEEDEDGIVEIKYHYHLGIADTYGEKAHPVLETTDLDVIKKYI